MEGGEFPHAGGGKEVASGAPEARDQGEIPLAEEAA